MTRTLAAKSDVTGCCNVCGADFSGDDARRWARKHARDTGHWTTVFEQYDAYRLDKNATPIISD